MTSTATKILWITEKIGEEKNAYAKHFHAERPDQGRENELLVRPPGAKKSMIADATAFSLRDIRCRKRLGGLLKHYERVAA